MLTDFCAALDKFSVTEDEKKDIMYGMDCMINQNELYHYPARFWDCAATGAFKECYLWSKVVIKFASVDNNTSDTEEKAYGKIVKSDVEPLFAATEFIPIPTYDYDIRSLYLDGDDGEEEDEDCYNTFDCIVIQERVKKVYTEMPNHSYPKDYISMTGKHLVDEKGNIIEWELEDRLRRVFNFFTWTQDAINCYGIDFMTKAVDLCEELGIYDIHQGNIGYRFDDTPVIFDFLS